MTTYHKDGGMGLVNDGNSSKPKDTKAVPFEVDYEETPAQVIFYMLDEATRRTTVSGGREFGQLSSKFGNTIFHHKDLDQRIDEYIERLLGERVTELVEPKPLGDTDSANPPDLGIGNTNPPPSGPSSTDRELDELIAQLGVPVNEDWIELSRGQQDELKQAITVLITKRELAARVKLLQELSTYMYQLHDNDLQGMERHIEVMLQADLTKGGEG